MQILKRETKVTEEDGCQEPFRVALIDGQRLTLRFPRKGKKKNGVEEDILINFTKEETNKIKRCIGRC